MFRKAVCFCLMLALAGPGGPAIAKEMTMQEVKGTIRQIVEKRVSCKVRLKDGTFLQGKIGESRDENFTIAGKREARTVAYADVAEVKKKELHPAAKVAIGFGIVIGIVFGIYGGICGIGHCG